MMRTTLATILMVAAGLCGAQDRMAEAIRKGIVEEETNHNLNAAIQSYQSAVAEFDLERQAAATALFRIAECERKLAKSSEAIAAYSRVVRDFADQARLAEESRNQLTDTYKIPAAAGAGAVDAGATQALRQYRGLLQQGIRAAQDELSLTEEMKASNYRPQADLASLRAELAAMDAGPAPKLPAAGTPGVASRARYRAALEAAVDDANRKVQGLREKFKLGTVARIEVNDAQNKVLYARIRLAALDAGMPLPNAAPAR